jgi:hypothetical protein
VEIRPLRAGEAAMMPYRMRSARGVTRESAPRLVAPARRIASQYPSDPFVQRALAEIEFDARNFAEAEAAADRALALEPTNIMAMAYKARIMGRRTAAAHGDTAAWRQVRSTILRANRLDPNHALPLVLYYDSFVAAGEPAPEAAKNGLLRAIVLVPQDETLRVRIAWDALRANDLPTVRRVLAPLAFSAHSGSENPALTIVNKIDANAPIEEIRQAATAAHFGDVNEFVEPQPAQPRPPAS